MKISISRYLLITAVAFLSVSGLFGGIMLMIDPSGSLLSMPLWLLDNTIFRTYLIPGVILFLFLGIFPAFTLYGLITKRQFIFTYKVSPYSNKHWAWVYSLYCGIILILWIEFQVMLIGYGHYIQIVYALLGVLIIILTILPSMMKCYRIKGRSSKGKKRKRG